ncbi:MAG TPA: serine/threonine-protein kinase [Lacipirellulaceae bacterium]|nr:serine/threonine-protein kinase [Lacipirellulaceae bacterium]
MPALLDMNTSPAETDEANRKQAMRFQHASGTRPLDGYTIKRGVGRGGFGEVYFAVSDAGKEVALKLIRRNLEIELRGVTHCLNLKHPNLIDIYDIRSDDHDDRWVVMEYVSGASLEDMIERHPQGMPRDMALHWFEGICAGVAYLHDHGVVHRDLKPANIFLDEGRVKIGDYGLSKFISCSRRSGQTESVGTVHYMAPEIANGRYGREIDAYALGIILYEMLTGSVPFVGESVGEVLMKHLTAEPDLSRLEEPYCSVVRGAMAKDPERRIDNAAEMMAMLRNVPRSAFKAEAFESHPPTFAQGTPHFAPAPAEAPRPAAAQQGAAGPRGYAAPGAAPPSPWVPLSLGEQLREFFHRDPEPAWAALVAMWRRLLVDIDYARFSPTGRIAFKIAVAAGIVVSSRVSVPLAAMALGWYILYRILRLFVQAVTTPPGPPPKPLQTPPVAPSESVSHPAPLQSVPVSLASSGSAADARRSGGDEGHEARRARRRSGKTAWRYAAYSLLATRPMHERLSVLCTSLLAAAIVAPVAALLVCLFTLREFNTELFIWSAVVGTLASWAIMAPAQLCEGRVEDQAPMRFCMLLAGALVGVLAWAVAQALYLDLPVVHDFGPRPGDALSGEMLGWDSEAISRGYSRGAVPLPLPMYAAYFAFLFAFIRWWRVAEWTRPARVSLWAIVWAGGVAFGVGLLWWFPQPLGIMAAVVISLTVQLASPWLSLGQRKQMAQAAVA